MNSRFYKIIRENAGFSRIKLTKIGHLDPVIEVIRTFKDATDRYLRIEFNAEPSPEFLATLDKRLLNFGQLEVLESSDALEELYQSCLPRTGGKTYLHYFDRKTYTRCE